MSALIYAVVVLWFWLTYEVGKFPNALPDGIIVEGIWYGYHEIDTIVA